MNSSIIFADLSTYTPEATMAFYEAVFGWSFYSENGYNMAYLGNQEIAGLYETPEKFRQMRMPHFWMTYIQVSNVERTVAEAKKLGGIVELSSPFPGWGTVALIRDPLGAGFTVYEGSVQKSVRTEDQPNTLIGNALHVSDVGKIAPFYEQLLGWRFTQSAPGEYHIHNPNNEFQASAMEIPNAWKGSYEYWVCTFGVTNVAASVEKALEHGGTVISDEGHRVLVTDHSQQAFFYLQAT